MSDWRAGAADRQAGEIRCDRHSAIAVLVPKREGAGNDLDSISLRPLIEAACVRGDNVDIVCFDVAAAHSVAGQ